MRVLGFSQRWPKLSNPEFTTFRFAREDREWTVGEQVQIVFRPRSKDREILGIAEIVNCEQRCMAWHGSRLKQQRVSNEEAIDDGFGDYFAMWEWLFYFYDGRRLLDEPMNKLTLRWREMP